MFFPTTADAVFTTGRQIAVRTQTERVKGGGMQTVNRLFDIL